MPKAVCGSNRPKRTASNSHWFALLLSCIGPVIPNTAKALEEEHPPTADSARYVELFEQGLQRYRADGRLQALLGKYGVSER